MSGVAAEVLSLEEALVALASPDAQERFSVAHEGRPLVVDWPGEHARPTAFSSFDLEDMGARLERLPSPTVAVVSGSGPESLAPLRDRFDVVASRAGELAAIRESVATHPHASLLLVQLLRASLDRSIWQGLIAESMAYSLLQAGPEFAAWRASRPVVPDPHAAAGPVVEAVREGNRLTVTLDRPQRHNAFSRAMRDEFCEALTLALADDAINEVELCGRGPSFCSGGDLDEFGQFPDPVSAHAVRLTRSPARLVAELADRLHVHVHGCCFGAGVELPAFATRVTATQDAIFALPEVSLGLVPGAGGTVSLPRRIGRQATAHLALTGEHIDAFRALELGLVDDVANVVP